MLYTPRVEECRRFYGSAARPRIAPGRHRLVDPDGRTVEITAVGRTESGSAQG
ncbi:hypothetical protein ACIQV3_00320 [Streptomyces sp. NPDC099050]|uniref:hypothetical protein n=1 Tax=Streptomyces sp. NPDC099050 TaxID=3366100 RepID=UPI00382B0B7B